MQFTEIKPGKTVEGSNIEAYRSDGKASKYVYFIAGVHGDEVEAVYLLSELFKHLQQDDDVTIPLIIIPILNIDGYRSGTRLNSHGVDLNRNLPTKDWSAEFTNKLYNPGEGPLSEPENDFLVKLLDKYPPYIVISLHSWKAHISYNGKCAEASEFLAKYNNYPIKNEVKRDFPGSLETYIPEKYNVPLITLITPKIKEDKTLKDVWEENREGLIELLKNGLLDPQNNLLAASQEEN